MNSSPMQSKTHFLIALTDTFGYAWSDRTKHALISVRDDGVGLPAGFDPSKSRGLGMRIIRHFQNDWGLPSAIAGMSMGRSSY